MAVEGADEPGIENSNDAEKNTRGDIGTTIGRVPLSVVRRRGFPRPAGCSR